MNKPTIIAHHASETLGACKNTLAALDEAVRMGAQMLKTDVRRTKDGDYVCHHDPYIGSRAISSMTYAEANRLAKKHDYSVPRLEDLLSHSTGKIRLALELREVGYEFDIVKMVAEALPLEDFVLKSFHDSSIFAIKKIEPKVTAGLLVDKHPFGNHWLDTLTLGSFEARILATRADFLSAENMLVNRWLARRMRLLKKPLFTWLVNDPTEIRTLASLGVAGIVTDRPDLALSLLGK